MMPVLIQGPKQPGNNIDVYLRPLVEELLELWNGNGVRTWDEHRQEEFNLKALLFVTINYWPTLSNLSGQTNKGYHACTVCGALRYKIRGDDPGDVDSEPPRKRVPAKVLWYAPIIPRLKRLFRNEEHAKLMRWHSEDRKKDGKLRAPADGS